jgi:hypothetical protein
MWDIQLRCSTRIWAWEIVMRICLFMKQFALFYKCIYMLRFRVMFSGCSKIVQRNSYTDFRVCLKEGTGLSTVHLYVTEVCLRAALIYIINIFILNIKLIVVYGGLLRNHCRYVRRQRYKFLRIRV